MVMPEVIEAWIKASLPCDYVKVEGDGHHFDAIVVSPEFQGKSRVQQHQLVYRALGDKMHAEIHALSMKTHTPQEWKLAHG
jgi:acid stress-induced BolA-like protein IbaG/YrbA